MGFVGSEFLGGGDPAAVASAGGSGGGLSNLFQNKLFLQYLSAAGQDISSGNSIGTNVNNVTQQNISSQNYMKVLQKMLAGNIPEGGKMTLDNKGMKLDVPQSALGSLGGEGGGGGSFLGNDPLGLKSTPQPQPLANPTNTNQQSAGLLNPFAGSLSGITASDLAGLSTTDLGNIFGNVLNVEQLRQKKVSEVADSLYKNKLMEQIDANIAEKTPSITIPGTDIKLTREEYVKWFASNNKDERTADIKNYEYAKDNGFVGSFTEFQDAKLTGNQKDYKAAVEGGYKGTFNQWLTQMKKAGATNISLDAKLLEKKAMSELSGQLYFNDPKWVDDLGKHMGSEDVQNKLFKSDKANEERTVEAVKFIESKITASGGTITGTKLDKDGTGTWTVKWPSGDTKTIKYKIK